MNAAMAHEVPGLLPRSAVSSKSRDEMFALLSRHFEGVERDQFERDLSEKNWVVQIRREGRLLGFSTLLIREVEFDGRTLNTIYSGDTIMEPEAWGSPALARTWIAAVNALRDTFPERPCYWLLLTSGYRTYRFLPVFWREFFPYHGAPTPARQQQLLDYLARQHYGDRFDTTAGIVRFPHPQRLREQLRAIPSGRVEDPHIAFFLARNPGHTDGDELVCITEISEANLTPAGRRMFPVAPR